MPAGGSLTTSRRADERLRRLRETTKASDGVVEMAKIR